jgi:mono/diheme cytochrome c family protein
MPKRLSGRVSASLALGIEKWRRALGALAVLGLVGCGGSEAPTTSDGAGANSGTQAQGNGGDANGESGGRSSSGGTAGSASSASGRGAGGAGAGGNGSMGAGGSGTGGSGAGGSGAAGSGGTGAGNGGSGGVSTGGSTADAGAGAQAASGSGGGSGAGGSGGSEPSWVVAFNTDPVNCATCHGVSGEGNGTYGPDIQHPTRDLFDFMLRTSDPQQLAVYRKPMLPFDTTVLSDADADAIFEWLSAMPKPESGAALYADYCSFCHGADGRGGTMDVAYASAYHSAPYRRVGAEFLAYVRAGHLVDDLGMPVPIADRHAYMPAFPPEMLTDAEIQLIEVWLPK